MKMIFKQKLEEYTEAEFLELLKGFSDFPTELNEDELDVYLDDLLRHFELITEHPGGSDVIYYPKAGQEDGLEGILKEVKEWRALNNKPGFKAQ